MPTKLQGSWKLLVAGVVIVTLGGCAATRSTIDVTAGKPAATPAAAPKALVAIVNVTDARVFEAAPSNPSTPSLKSADDLKNPAIKARAVARKRGGFGAALGDVLLPEGRTVEQLVREAATQALNEKGYGVVAAGTANAQPLDIEIKQYWSWFTPGFWTVSLEFEGIVAMKGSMVLGDQPTVRGYAVVQTLAATEGQWSSTLQQGYDDLVQKMKAALRAP